MGRNGNLTLAIGAGLVMLCCACGGNGSVNSVLQKSQPTGAAGNSIPGSIPVQLDLEAGKPGAMKNRQVFNYRLEGFKQDNGISLVPMLSRTEPDFSANEQYNLSTAVQNDKVIVKLQVDSAEKLHVHLHFDPVVWQPGGVTSKNVWGTDKFLAAAAYHEPGLLMLYSMPVGDSTIATANGEFAELELLPAGNRQVNTSLTPGGEQSINVIWLKESSSLYEGQVHFRLDGTFGDYESKDDVLDSTERSAQNIDNLVHDAGVFYMDPNTSELIDGYGRSYFGASWEPLYLNWSEFFRGDHDNSGYIDIYDVTPIGQHWSANGNEYYSSRGNEIVGGSWFNLYQKMLEDSTTDLPHYDWRREGNSFISFWYLDQDSEQGPSFFNFDATETPIANALDSNWDGFVQDWLNEDDPLDFDDELDSYYDEPGNGKYHPGDLEGMYTHWNEEMSGYEVWTVPTGG